MIEWKYLFLGLKPERLAGAALPFAIAIIFLLISGCSGVDQISDKTREISRAGRDIERVTRSVGGVIEETGEAAEAAKETGQKFRSLRKKSLVVELQMPSGLTNVNLRVRPAGMNEFTAIESGDFARFRWPITRFADAANRSIYTEFNGFGVPVAIERVYVDEIDAGSTVLLVLVRKSDDTLVWIPPSERGSDEAIVFDASS